MSAIVFLHDAAAFALGAVTANEHEAFEHLMQRDPALARQVDAYARVAAMLAFAAPRSEPPQGLRERIVASATKRAP